MKNIKFCRKAQEVYEDEKATQEEVDEALKTLEAASKVLVKKQIRRYWKKQSRKQKYYKKNCMKISME